MERREEEISSDESMDGSTTSEETNDEMLDAAIDDILQDYYYVRGRVLFLEKRVEELRKGELCSKGYKPRPYIVMMRRIQKVKEEAQFRAKSSEEKKSLSTLRERCTKVLEEVKKIPIIGKGRRKARLAVKTMMQCPICLVRRRTYSFLNLNCGHQFCKGCLASHLELSNRCPYCRASIKSVHGDHDYKLWWEGKKMIVHILPYEESQSCEVETQK